MFFSVCWFLNIFHRDQLRPQTGSQGYGGLILPCACSRGAVVEVGYLMVPCLVVEVGYLIILWSVCCSLPFLPSWPWALRLGPPGAEVGWLWVWERQTSKERMRVTGESVTAEAAGRGIGFSRTGRRSGESFHWSLERWISRRQRGGAPGTGQPAPTLWKNWACLEIRYREVRVAGWEEGGDGETERGASILR